MTKSWYEIRALATGAEIMIYDEIGVWGVTAKQFITDLAALGDVEAITLRINSPGGDVFDGWAIYNALSRNPARKTVCIDGLAASMASVVAMAGDEIVMPENAMMMIHEPMMMAFGTAEELRAGAASLDKMAESIVRAYAARSGQDDTAVRTMMADETWLSAAEAVEIGFADRIDQPVKMAAKFDLSKFRRAPEALLDVGEDTPPAAADPVSELAPVPSDEDAPPADTIPAVDPDVMSAAARADALGYACQVLDLCALAGLTNLAGVFLAQSTPLAEVRASLQQERARQDAETIINGTRGASAVRMPADAGWGDAINRVCKR